MSGGYDPNENLVIVRRALAVEKDRESMTRGAPSRVV
jgi:hypothetical protein